MDLWTEMKLRTFIAITDGSTNGKGEWMKTFSKCDMMNQLKEWKASSDLNLTTLGKEGNYLAYSKESFYRERMGGTGDNLCIGSQPFIKHSIHLSHDAQVYLLTLWKLSDDWSREDYCIFYLTNQRGSKKNSLMRKFVMHNCQSFIMIGWANHHYMGTSGHMLKG